ncbi:imidazole glycerol phosphate synthase subunit HisH [Schaalia sp. ZJ1691]|uniref:imidazole glycerol phosphate synthase subunit HisH n=1 Tax=Schaalia sp. ZJ1691 TaxID=2709404 RepID=UPI0013EAC0BC|nr:imidazole glycerol phosphate synthase subunit HisH [Schaalia sp. ZJ1691]
MVSPRVVVLDYGSGNVRSACRALEKVGADVELTAEQDAVLNADGLLVPGVGAFGAVMEQLTAMRAPFLIDQRLAGGRAVMGVCVGLQVMFERSAEKGEHEGLGQWPGTVDRLDAPVIPHMGWSPVDAAPRSELFDGVEDERFYFVHSYAALTDPGEGWDAGPLPAPKASWATHGNSRFIAAVENGALRGTQFHPEKSGDAGLHLLENWLQTL